MLRGLCLLASSGKSGADDIKLPTRFLSVIAAPLSKADGQKGSGAFLALLSSWVQPAWTRGWHHMGVPCKVLSFLTATGRQWQASEPPGHHQWSAPGLCRLRRQPHAVLIQCTGAQGGHTHPQCSHPSLISSADVRGLLGHEGTSCTRGRGPAHAPLATGTGDRGRDPTAAGARTQGSRVLPGCV